MAATSVGQIGLDLVVNENRFQSQMNGIGNTARRAANTLQNQIQPQLEGITSMAKKAGVALAAAFSVKKIVDFGKQCLELGSDLAEVQNVVDVTFPSMTAQVDEFAKSAAQSFGLSETMAKQYTGTFGAMAKAFGFTEQQAYDMGSTLTGLAGDVASFYNLSQDEAYTKLKSVFTGETESLKDLGVVITQTALDSYALANGFGKTTSAMTETEKVALRYRFVQDQLSAAQGDFARTSDSWANQVRILKLQMQSFMATVGQGLINLFTPVIKVINIVIGKLATLANAFKSFTELITGNKSSGTDSGIAATAEAAGTASEGLENASDSAANLANSTNKAGQAAQNTAKKMRALMGFDKINKLDSQDTGTSGTGDSSSPSGTSGTGTLGSGVDFGNLAQGDNVVEKTNKQISALLERCRELAKLFKKGFEIGFGDSQKKIDAINESMKNIGKNLKEIFTDKAVVNAANRCADNISLALGKITGSVARIGLTLADNLIGGIDKYLSKSKNYIKKRIVSLFDVTTDIAKLSGDFAVAIADIFDVFSGDDAKAITGDFIQVFADAFLGIADLALKFKRDFISLFTVPIIQNVDKISTTLENVQSQWRIVFDALAQSVTDTFDKINQVYDQYVKPFVDSIVQGISDILGTFLDAYNTYISPVLDQLAERFGTVWSEHVQPAINGFLELIGKVFENLQALWETLLEPLIEWIINTVVPIIAPIIASIGNQLLDILQVASDVFTGIMEILGGFLDFCTGAFKGDFGKCWQGIEEIFQGFKTIAAGIFEYLKTTVFQPFIDFIKNIFTTDWSQSFGTLGRVLNTFLSGVKQMWNNVKKIFNGIVDFITGTFSGNWEQAWNGIAEIFGGIFDNLVTLAKTPLNMVIDIINSLMEKINSGLSAIENAFSFNYDFTNPITGTRHYGHYGMSLPRVPEIPHLANGGYVKPNTPQLAMIGDNLHQGEVVAPEDKLKQMAIEAAMTAGSRGVSRDELESIINRAVMRIVSALTSMGFYLDSTQIANAQREAMTVMDIRNNTVEVR